MTPPHDREQADAEIVEDRKPGEPRVRFRRRSSGSKYGSITHIILLGAAMAVIVWLVFFLDRDSDGGEEAAPAEENPTTPVSVNTTELDIDENLINYYAEGFQLLRPNTNWDFIHGGQLSYNGIDDFTDEMWLNAAEIARLTLFDAERDVVNVRVGKLKLPEGQNRVAETVARQSFERIIAYALNPDHPYKVDTWQPIETLDSGDLKGSYYLLKVTHSRDTQADMRLVAFYVKNDFVYSLIGEVSYEEYHIYKSDLEKIVRGFVFI